MKRQPQYMPGGNVPPSFAGQHPARRLPTFYARAVTTPQPHVFAQAAEYARWSLVWIQLVLLLIIPAALGLLRSVLRDTSSGIDTRSNVFFGFMDVLTVGATIAAFGLKVVFVPLLFFVGAALQYLLARAFGGHGRFVSHCFDMLLYQVPLAFIGALIITVFVALHFSTLFFAPIISVALFFYGIFVNTSVVMGVHGLNREKSIITVAIPYILGVMAVCGLLAVLAHSIANMLHMAH
ncbi:hypothetical protein KSC_089390 [Ktedonobacter sp. SOSP1-52]|uniref:YIP1 family protein n=1 Tax=Ktedonobacter sp. SOSP1-52 TaxID=2778366 RepID=UPI001916723C|nr:YIP1 family protein [Ktedonobacter sp. SOSP1-52]GHO70047.1 hypothetical protein KSC_089390 [Ktedonobacter sp. SOSP1-52]